jgi:hypothetical protein
VRDIARALLTVAALQLIAQAFYHRHPATSLGLQWAIAIRPSEIFSKTAGKVFSKNWG